jgi:hypothetical protein
MYSSSMSLITSRDSSVGIVTGYWLDGRGSVPVRDKILPFSITSKSALGLTQPAIQWVSGTLYPGVKRQGREAHHSSPTSAEVENVGAILTLPHTNSWCDAKFIMHRDKFTFTLCL